MDGSNSGSADTGLALSWPHGTVNLGILLGGLTPNQSITASEARKKALMVLLYITQIYLSYVISIVKNLVALNID